jgi:GNAT superfamily N-acetyltransferase
MRAQEFLTEISDERLQQYLSRAGQQVDRRLDRMASVRDRLNKGYEIYHADRPANGSSIVDRFEANTPALAQRYYEKFIQDYDSDVDFDLRLRRATGIIEDAEPKVQQAQRDGLDLTAHRHGNELTIDADTHGRNLARVVFDVNGQTVVARDLLVDERYRGQGIAASMYDWAKELGYRVQRSADQTDAGKQFWNKNRGSKQVWETELDENFADGKKPGRKGLAKKVGVNCKQPVSKLRSIAAHSSGEKQRMAHWCANMKSGKKK